MAGLQRSKMLIQKQLIWEAKLSQTSCGRHEPRSPKGIGIVKVAKAVGVGMVARLKNQMMEAREAA
jgi:hypothetical protein